MTADELKKNLGDRVYSRVVLNSKSIELKGKDKNAETEFFVLSSSRNILNFINEVQSEENNLIDNSMSDNFCISDTQNVLKNEYNLNLVASHINHGIRGEEAERDALFSKTFSESLGVNFKMIKVDCIGEAKKTGETVEETGRRLRYEFWDSLCEDKNTVIATAHNSNDNAETVIFNITRGSALSGAKGIPPKRDNIIRPLILCTREEIEGYCKENNLSFVTDSTNLTVDYTRNRIRHNILPELEKVNSGVVEAFTRFSESVRIDDNYLEFVAENALKDYGIRIEKVKIKRLALPTNNIESVFEQMIADREKQVTKLISEGERDAAIIMSEANARAAEILAEGKLEAAEIHAETERQIA
mgnify:CR=1 FL=1